jgi:hypothetical protein
MLQHTCSFLTVLKSSRASKERHLPDVQGHLSPDDSRATGEHIELEALGNLVDGEEEMVQSNIWVET